MHPPRRRSESGGRNRLSQHKHLFNVNLFRRQQNLIVRDGFLERNGYNLLEKQAIHVP